MTNAANEMGVFERVVERGSFAAAAQDVGLSPLGGVEAHFTTSNTASVFG